jgi:2-phospho-L-lactate guanylyltransferase
MTRAIVPVKGLAGAKTRLAHVLSPEQREQLTLRMLSRVLGALRQSGAVDDATVVTPDVRVADLALGAGAAVVWEREHELNAAVSEARERAGAGAMSGCLVVLGDLPWLSGAEVAGLVRCGEPEGACVAAVDRYGRGTNALLLRPADALPLLFGAHSYGRYRDAAAVRGVSLLTYHSPGTTFDVDTPEDLDILRASEDGARLLADDATPVAAERA